MTRRTLRGFFDHWCTCLKTGSTMPQFVWLLGMVYLYITTFMFLLPWLCSDLGFSVYYTKSGRTMEHLESINNERTAKAKRFFASAPVLEAKPIHGKLGPNKDLRFGFIVVSVKRKNDPHYLLQVVARLMAQTLKEKIVKTQTIVLNVDEVPSFHRDAEFLSNYVTVLVQKSARQKRNVALVYDSIYEKEKQDYMFALQAGIQLGAQYTVIIEDDALPDNRLIDKLQLITQHKIPGNWHKPHKNWAFLKLYYPEKWQGYGNTEILELICFFIIGGAIPVFILTKLLRSQNLRMMFFLFFASGLYTTALTYGIGRAHLIELRKLSPLFYTVSKAPGCCTPAVLYPKAYITQLVGFLSTKKCSKDYPLDIAIDEFAKTLQLQKYLVTPNLFTHIGFHSSLNKADKDLREFNLLFNP